MMTPKIIHKIVIPKKDSFFWEKQQKNIEYKNLELQKVVRAYV